MSETQPQTSTQDAKVAVTLQLDPEVYEFFLEKSRNANIGIESYLASTLSIVLGCKAFNKMSTCSPQPIKEGN